MEVTEPLAYMSKSLITMLLPTNNAVQAPVPTTSAITWATYGSVSALSHWTWSLIAVSIWKRKMTCNKFKLSNVQVHGDRTALHTEFYQVVLSAWDNGEVSGLLIFVCFCTQLFHVQWNRWHKSHLFQKKKKEVQTVQDQSMIVKLYKASQ